MDNILYICVYKDKCSIKNKDECEHCVDHKYNTTCDMVNCMYMKNTTITCIPIKSDIDDLFDDLLDDMGITKEVKKKKNEEDTWDTGKKDDWSENIWTV